MTNCYQKYMGVGECKLFSLHTAKNLVQDIAMLFSCFFTNICFVQFHYYFVIVLLIRYVASTSFGGRRI